MNLHTYSIILGLGSIAVFLLTFILTIGILFGGKTRKHIDRFLSYENCMRIIGFLAIGSTVWVLTYQFYYELEVCILCWWQRIFMFPIDVIVLISLFYGIRKNHIIILILALFGSFFAGYHYYYHFQWWVLWRIVELPCTVWGLLPACTDNNWVFVFWFLTIPGMALLIFLTIILLSGLAHRKS